MSSPMIQSVLRDMQALSGQAGLGSGQRINTRVGEGGFADELQQSITKVNQLQQQAENKVQAFESGAADVALNDVMVDIQKAQMAMQMSVQVRNRLVSAYKEIMNMQV